MSLTAANRDVVPVLRSGRLLEQRKFLVSSVGFELGPKVQLLQVCFAKALLGLCAIRQRPVTHSLQRILNVATRLDHLTRKASS